MPEWIDILMYLGALGALIIFVVGLMRKDWLMSAHHEEVIARFQEVIVLWKERYDDKDAECEDWKRMAMETAQITDKTLETARKAAQ